MKAREKSWIIGEKRREESRQPIKDLAYTAPDWLWEQRLILIGQVRMYEYQFSTNHRGSASATR